MSPFGHIAGVALESAVLRVKGFGPKGSGKAGDIWIAKDRSHTGIYIGNGFDSQFVISYEADRREIISRCGNSFGYAIRKNKATLVKLLGVEEKRDDDEQSINQGVCTAFRKKI